MKALATALLVTLAAGTLAAAEIPGAVLLLETAPGTSGSDASAAPPRFVLLKDGEVFLGGSARMQVGRLEKADAQALRKRAEKAVRLAGRAGELALGGGDRVFRLRLPENDAATLTITGDPASAAAAGQEAAALVAELLRFDHPSLVPYAPASYALGAREGALAGGCRPWGFPFPIEEAVSAPRAVPAADAVGWPTGALPASVCAGGRRFVVTLRPLLPGERP